MYTTNRDRVVKHRNLLHRRSVYRLNAVRHQQKKWIIPVAGIFLAITVGVLLWLWPGILRNEWSPFGHHKPGTPTQHGPDKRRSGSAGEERPSHITSCKTTSPKHSTLKTATDPLLRKLAEYEAVCGGAFSNQLMLFAAMPRTTAEATQNAADIAVTLKSFAARQISPLVVFEPPLDTPGVLKDIRNGAYDAALAAYYGALRTKGITSQMMGMWVLFPEANTPQWGTTNAGDFTANVTKVASMQKQYFPASKATILLNSQSYPDNDTNWEHATYASLVPYVQNLPKGLIDSFGYQGFPWQPEAGDKTSGSVLDPALFLRTDLATNAAKALGVHNVWLNTGTYTTIHANSTDGIVSMALDRREIILDGIVDQVAALRRSGYAVTVNIFAQNKSKIADEYTDWSYWKPGQEMSSAASTMLKSFIGQVRDTGSKISLYDTQ